MRASLPQLMNRYPVPVRRGLADQLVEHLITAILRGDHPPDSQLPPEGRLAELFDVSRLTVREAVKALRSKGVVRIEQGRGTFVNPPSHWSPLDRELAMKLTEARVLVEVGVAGLAARRRTRADLTELKRALDRMRRASDRDDVDGVTEADLEFHGIIMAAAGNPFVTALFEPLVDLLFEVRRASSGARLGREKAIAAHARILEALRSGSPEAASDAMVVHMRETAERIDEVIRQDDMRLSLPRRIRQ